MSEEKICFKYVCDHYPRCERARGKGCSIDRDERIPTVEEGECTAENGYLLFREAPAPYRRPTV